MDMTVITYGGGEILKNIFESIAMLLNSQSGSLLKPLTIITVSIGALWAVLSSILANSSQAFLSKYLIPMVTIIGLLMIPSGSVHIEDVLKDRSYKIDHVPLFIAKFAELASTIGYKITVAVEKVMHVPNDTSYNSTGMIFGADSALDMSRYQISNAELDQNLRRFCKQCVLYDIALGRYTLDELKKSTDLWKFFGEKTSKVRMMTYTPIGEKEEGKKVRYVSCKDAIKNMTPYFNQEKRYFGQLDVIKNLPLTFQAITGIQREKGELISQQLMMHLLKDEYGGKNFASSRASAQQRNTYQILGSLASSSLITLRAVIEALIYASFIFILPLSVLPGGVKYLGTWMGLVVWIQMWPPFYAILNYIMQSVSHGYAETVFHSLTGAHRGLSLFTSIGINNLQTDIYALSGYLAASIPFLTYAILKGGVGSFIHLAGAMMTPAHTAASTAAAEQTTGNYSFGNASYGQTSYQNTSGLNTSLSPTISSGFFQENKGSHSVTYGGSEQIIKQSNSDLRTSVFSDDSFTQSLQKAKMHAESTAESSQKTYSENINSHARHMVDLSDHLSKSDSYSENISEREACDIQESARYFQNTAESWGKQHGLSSREGAEHLAGLGINFLVAGKSSVNLGASKDQALSSANNILKSEEFQHHFQRLQDFSQTKAANSLDEQGSRLVEGYSQSLEQMSSSQEAFQSAHTTLNQASENISWAEQNSHLIRRSLNQDFVNWATEQYAQEGGASKVESILTRGDRSEQESLVNHFIGHLRANVSEKHFSDSISSTDQLAPKGVSETDTESFMQQMVQEKQKGFSNHPHQKRDALGERFLEARDSTREDFRHTADKLDLSREKASEEFEEESGRLLITKAIKPKELAAKVLRSPPGSFLSKLGGKITGQENKKSEIKEAANSFQSQKAPFWMKKNT